VTPITKKDDKKQTYNKENINFDSSSSKTGIKLKKGWFTLEDDNKI